MSRKFIYLTCLAAGLLGSGCQTAPQIEVQGTFDELWDVARSTVTNQGFRILLDKVADPDVSRTCGVLAGRRQAEDRPAKTGGSEMLSQREPWDQVRITLCPVKPRTNTVARRFRIEASTQQTDLLILRGRVRDLPDVQAAMMEALQVRLDQHEAPEEATGPEGR